MTSRQFRRSSRRRLIACAYLTAAVVLAVVTVGLQGEDLSECPSQGFVKLSQPDTICQLIISDGQTLIVSANRPFQLEGQEYLGHLGQGLGAGQTELEFNGPINAVFRLEEGQWRVEPSSNDVSPQATPR